MTIDLFNQLQLDDKQFLTCNTIAGDMLYHMLQRYPAFTQNIYTFWHITWEVTQCQHKLDATIPYILDIPKQINLNFLAIFAIKSFLLVNQKNHNSVQIEFDNDTIQALISMLALKKSSKKLLEDVVKFIDDIIQYHKNQVDEFFNEPHNP